jgi:hypothetical protein
MMTPKTPKTGRKPPQRPVADKEQYERFREFAREVGADGDAGEFDSSFRRLVPPKEPIPETE